MIDPQDREHWVLGIKASKAYLGGTATLWLGFMLIGISTRCGRVEWLSWAATVLICVSALFAARYFIISRRQIVRLEAKLRDLLEQ